MLRIVLVVCVALLGVGSRADCSFRPVPPSENFSNFARAMFYYDTARQYLMATQVTTYVDCNSTSTVPQYESRVLAQLSSQNILPAIGRAAKDSGIGFDSNIAVPVLKALEPITVSNRTLLAISGFVDKLHLPLPFACLLSLTATSNAKPNQNLGGANTIFDVLWCRVLSYMTEETEASLISVSDYPFALRFQFEEDLSGYLFAVFGSQLTVMEAASGGLVVGVSSSNSTNTAGCIPSVPELHYYFSWASRAPSLQATDFITSLDVSVDGKFLAIGTAGRLAYIGHVIGQSSISACYGQSSVDIIARTTEFAWESTLLKNFVMVLDIDRFVKTQECSPLSDSTTSPVILLEDNCFQPVKSLAFSPTLFENKYHVLLHNPTSPVHSSPTQHVINTHNISHVTSFEAMSNKLTACQDTCTSLETTFAEPTCVDSTSFKDRNGQGCDYYRASILHLNTTCAQIATRDGTLPQVVETYCKATCTCLDVASFTSYSGTVCEGSRAWTCEMCYNNLLANSTCISEDCFYWNNDEVLSHCNTTCVSALDDLNTCASRTPTSAASSSQSACNVDFSDSIGLFQNNEEVDMLTCHNTTSTEYNTILQNLTGSGYVNKISWTKNLLAVSTSLGLYLYKNYTFLDFDFNNGTLTPSYALDATNLVESFFNSDGSMVALKHSTSAASLTLYDFVTDSSFLVNEVAMEAARTTGAVVFGSGFPPASVFTPDFAGKRFLTTGFATNQTEFMFNVSFSAPVAGVSNNSFLLEAYSGQEVNSSKWQITRLRELVQGFQYRFEGKIDASIPDGLYILAPKFQLNVFNEHLVLLDRVNPQLRIISNEASTHVNPECDAVSRTAFVHFMIETSEHTTDLCVNGPYHAFQTEPKLRTDPMFQPIANFTSSSDTCQSTACSDTRCGILMAVACSMCTVNVTIPANSVTDVAANPNLVSNTFRVCFDKIRPIPTFFYNGSAIDHTLVVSSPVHLTLDFGEVVFGMNASLIKCNCNVKNFRNLSQTFEFDLEFTSVATYSISVEAEEVSDYAGNLNSRNEITLVTQPVFEYLSLAVFAAIMVLDSIIICAIVVTGGLVHKYRDTAVLRASTPLFSQIILVGLFFVVIANILFGVAMLDFSTHVRENCCEAALHLGAYGVTTYKSAIVLRNYRVWRVLDNPKLKNVSIKTRDLVLAVSAVVLVVGVLMITWSGVYGATSEPSHLNEDSFYTCKFSGAPILFTVAALIGTMYLFGAFVVARIYKTKVDGPFNETKAIAFSFYNSMFVVITFVVVQSSMKTATASFILISMMLVYFIASPLVVMYWLTKFVSIYHALKEPNMSQSQASSTKKSSNTNTNTNSNHKNTTTNNARNTRYTNTGARNRNGTEAELPSIASVLSASPKKQLDPNMVPL